MFATNETSVNGKGDIDFTYSPREDCLSLLRKEKQYLVGTVEFCGHTLFKPARTYDELTDFKNRLMLINQKIIIEKLMIDEIFRNHEILKSDQLAHH